MLAVPLVQAIVRRWLQSAHILQSAEVASSINQVEFLSANNVRVYVHWLFPLTQHRLKLSTCVQWPLSSLEPL